MAAFLLLPRRSTLALGLTAAGAASILNNPLGQRRRLFLDSSTSGGVSPRDWSFSQYQRDASAPVVRPGGGLNPAAVRQISAGSICGVAVGLGISLFSKPLAVLLGLLLFGVQFLESRGVSLIPYRRIQGYMGSIDLRSAVQDNAAFKLAFGATCGLAGFASL